MKKHKVAIIYDKATTWGGAERLLLAMHDAYPDAPLYTLVWNSELPWSKKFGKIYTSWVQKISFLRNRPQLLALWAGAIFEQFDLSNYDIVISVTSYDAKAVRTNPNTLHICYCLTPNRFLWVEPGYAKFSGFGLISPVINFLKKLLLNRLRINDQIVSKNPDEYYTLSNLVRKRILKFYNRPSTVIYPGVDTKIFKPNNIFRKRKHFLIVSRLTGYKHISQLIKLFNKLPYRLVIVGDGPDKHKLKGLIKSKNIRMLGKVDDESLIKLYQEAHGLFMLQEEDFGLVVLESLACGTPVIVNRRSGVSELIKNGVHGLILDEISSHRIKLAIKEVLRTRWNDSKLLQIANKYDWSRFVKELKKQVRKSWSDFNLD